MGHIISKLKHLKNPIEVWKKIGRHGYPFVTDKLFCKIMHRLETGRNLSLKNPTSYTEKISYLMLKDHNPFYSKLVDKYDVRAYVSKQIGEEYLCKFYGVYNNLKKIDISSLPNSFVLKATHGTGATILCLDKSKVDWNNAGQIMKSWLKHDYYKNLREWPYKNLKHRIICEHLMSVDGKVPNDYKIYCFNGEPKLIHVDVDRFENHKRSVFFPDWTLVSATLRYPSAGDLPKPSVLDEMLYLSRELSKGLTFVRVDLYDIAGKVIFGEMTFYPGGGIEFFEPLDFEYEVGTWIDLATV